MQRKLYRQKSNVIQGERTEKLDSIGFAWGGKGLVKVSWDERLEECRNFRHKHGHLSVPFPPSSKSQSEANDDDNDEEEQLTPQEKRYE